MVCTGCQRENPDDARFCNGCGRPVGDTAPAPRDPRDYTPRHLAERILVSRPALEGERKQVSVLFADIKGSMELAEQVDPEAWHVILDRYFRVLADGVHRHEGTINQYTGDGVMALFGAPIAHEDHAQRACAAALALQGELRGFARELRDEPGIEFETRMGINSGEVVVGRIGDDLRMDYTAQGHTVGLAHRVEQLARAGRTYLAEETARLVEGYFLLRDLGVRELKGASGPVRVYELAGKGDLRTRLDRSRSLGFSRFVGRETELASLGDALAGAQRGEGRVVLLVAEPGTGKSRLAQEFVERARGQGAAVREAHALAQTREAPLHGLAQLVRSSLGLGGSDAPEVVRATVRARLSELGNQDPESAGLVCDLLGAPDPREPPPEMDPDARRRRLEEPLLRIVITPPTAAVGPTLLRVEDLHWLDPASCALLGSIARRVASTSRFLTGSARRRAAPAVAQGERAAARKAVAAARREIASTGAVVYRRELASLAAVVDED
jgi:class 3 adenylate cyclase